MSFKIAEDLFKCPCCREYKHREDFPRDRSASSGVASYCRVCSAQYSLARRWSQDLPAREPVEVEVKLRKPPKERGRKLEKFYARFN